jgi:hypothetical protein
MPHTARLSQITARKQAWPALAGMMLNHCSGVYKRSAVGKSPVRRRMK